MNDAKVHSKLVQKLTNTGSLLMATYEDAVGFASVRKYDHKISSLVIFPDK